MATTPTQLPVSSEKPQDLKFNAGKIDEFVTSMGWTYTDRFGNKHYTIEGINHLAQQVMSAFGYVTLTGLNFTTGATVSNPNEVLFNTADNSYYKWAGSFASGPKVVPPNSTPDSTGGIGPGRWLNVGDTALRSELAANGGVDHVNGAAKQEDVDSINLKVGNYVTPEQFSSLVVGGDWSDAIQAMWDTGLPPLFKTGFEYTISKIITTKGQIYYGRPTLKLIRSSIPNVTVVGEYSEPDSNIFRGIYVGTAYDWCEFVRIKELGLNTLMHYLYFDNNPTVDGAGTISQAVLNARSAGLNIVINLQHQDEHGNGSEADIISSIDKYDNVIGYSIMDEPGSNGISVATQDSAISAARSLTKKKLYSVDFVWRLSTWKKPWSTKFDVFLVDSYGMYYASGDLSTRVGKDLGKFRTDFGALKKMVGDARVIPCFQAYAEPTTTPVEGVSGTYCFDIPQIAAGSRIFGKVGNGDFCCFTWDNLFHDTVSNNQTFQDVIRDVVNNSGKGRIYKTEPLLFGGVASVKQRPVSELFKKVAFKDPNNSTDTFLGGGAWPVRVITGASETPLHTTTAGVDIAGIGFKDAFSRLVLNHDALEYCSAFGVFENLATGTATLNFYSSPDAGYTQDGFYSQIQAAGQEFRFSNKVTNFYEGTGSSLVVGLSLSSSSDYLPNYRRFIYGLIVTTNW